MIKKSHLDSYLIRLKRNSVPKGKKHHPNKGAAINTHITYGKITNKNPM